MWVNDRLESEALMTTALINLDQPRPMADADSQ
jgi:hypothetical protein